MMFNKFNLIEGDYGHQHYQAQLPAVADQLPLSRFPCVGPTEWGQDDQRAPQRTEGQPPPVLPERPYL